MEAGTLDGTELAGRYRIRGLLGRGGMAEVYDAVDTRLERPVALKVLRPEMAANPDVRRRFEAEALAAARLSHPNVVGVFDTGEEDETPFIVMERLPGETMADRLAAGPADEAWVRAVTADVLLALGAAHAAGIVHRDVKPGNVLLAPDGRAKVADFGIAKSTEALGPGEDHTATNILVGTPAYLAPERIDGEPATPRSDLYSLGVVLYEALAGRKPFSGPTPLAVAQAVRAGAAPPLAELRPGVDPTLAAVTATAMAPDPAARYPSADAMYTALTGTDATVAIPVGDSDTAPIDRTAIMEAPVTAAATAAGASPLPAALSGARSARRGGHGRRRLVAALAGGAVLLVLLALLFSVPHRSAPGSQAAAAASRSLATRMRDLATRLQEGDGPAGPVVASRLDDIASQLVARKDVTAPASALAQLVAVQAGAGQLSSQGAEQAMELLRLAGATVPTTQPTAPATPPPTAAAPAASTAPAPPAAGAVPAPVVRPAPPSPRHHGKGGKGGGKD